jgi:peptide/nickel transport system substrate-binding protein
MAVIILLLCAATYIITDNLDMIRQNQHELKDSNKKNSAAIRRLQDKINNPLFTASSSRSSAPEMEIEFHNASLYDKDAVPGGTRISAVGSFSGNMNSIINNEATVSDLWGYCNDSLGARSYKDPKVFQPRMATSWIISADGKTFTIKLRKGIKWHDFTDPVTKKEYVGIPVTANDFAFYIDTIRNENLPCDPIRNYYKDLDKIEVIDDHNFKVVWKETYFRAIDFTLGLSPLPRQLYRPDPETTDEEFAEDMIKNKVARNQIIIGCGAYIFDKYIKGDRIILKLNPEYFGIKPAIETLVFREIKDAEKRFLEFKSGKLDAIGLTSVQWIKQSKEPDFITITDDVNNGESLSKIHDLNKKVALNKSKPFGNHKFEKFLYRSFSYSFICWNMRRPILSDKMVRRALTHCVNREKIIKEVFFNLGTLTTGNFVPHSLYYDKSIKPWSFDIDKAKVILKEAGWRDSNNDGIIDKDLNGDGKAEPFEFTFLAIQNHPSQTQWVPIIRDDFLKAGINMKVKQAEWSVYTEQIGKFDFDACSFGWRGGIESDPYQIWHSSQADKEDSSNYTGFKDKEADEIIETARKTLNIDKRIALYKRFHQIIHDEQPYTFLYCPNAKVAQNKKFFNAIVYDLGMSNSLQWIPEKMQQE